MIHKWVAEDKPPVGEARRIVQPRRPVVTIRVDTKVVAESDDLDGAKSDETAWMRFTLDTVGREEWPRGTQGRPIYPLGFEELAGKLDRPLHPPGRDVRLHCQRGDAD